MEQRGYTQQTILNYVKGINLYLDYMGWSEIWFNRGKAKELLEYYEELHKNDYKPDRSALPKVENEPLIVEGERVIRPTVARSNNTSGYPGVAKVKKKWERPFPIKRNSMCLATFRGKRMPSPPEWMRRKG